MPALPPARRARLLAWVSALLAVAALACVAPAQAAAEPVTVTFTPVGDWYESGGGAGNQYRVDLADAAGTPLPPEAVTVIINGTSQAPRPVSGRVVEVTGPVRSGANTVAVHYLGDGGFDGPELTTTVTALPATTLSTVTFKAPSTIAHGKALPVQVVVKAGTASPDGEVRVSVDGSTAGSARLTDGRASVAVGSLAPGPRQVAVTYGGWRGIAASSAAPVTVTVGPASLTVADQPWIQGSVIEGAVVDATTAGPHPWNEPVDQVTYQWSADGVPLKGATARTLTIPSSAVGKRLTVAVRGRLAGYVDSTVTSAPTARVRSGASQLAVRGHVQSIGWQPWRTGNGVIGTTGRGLRIEALQLKLVDPVYSGGIAAQAHVQNIGWTDSVSEGATIGTTGRGLRVEAVNLALTGEIAEHYDLWYRAHVQNYGWLGWTSNGSSAGTEGKSLRVEALEIRVQPKGSAAPAKSGAAFIAWYDDPNLLIQAQAHVQNIGWQAPARGGTVLGTTGRGLRLEALNLSYLGDGPLTAQAHVQNRGWMAPVSVSHSGGIVGTEGQGLRMEAIRLNLPSSSGYRIYYRTHVQNIGWTGWTTNGQPSGSAGFGYRMEAVDVRVVPKGKPAPASNGVPAFFQR